MKVAAALLLWLAVESGGQSLAHPSGRAQGQDAVQQTNGRGAIGVNCKPEANGCRIQRINKDGPAERAGLRVADLLLRLNPSDSASAVEQIAKTAPGTKIMLPVQRGSEHIQVPITVDDQLAFALRGASSSACSRFSSFSGAGAAATASPLLSDGRTHHMKFSLWLSWTVLGAGVWLQQTAIRSQEKQAFSTVQFRLLTRPTGFALQFVSNGKRRQISVPRDWLIPQNAKKEEEEGAYVSSFNYDTEVQSFGIGNGQIGLHLSSYDIEREGTGHAAAGRDVFLIFDPKSLLVTRGGIERGVTKWRVRSEGCLSAAAEHYLVADVDQDRRVDVGVVAEEIRCVEKYNKDEDKEWMEPTYKQYPTVWYVFRDNVWELEPKYSGKIPESVAELPLIGKAASDVNDLPLGLWRKFDPSRWLAPNENPPAYVPAYWKNKVQTPAALSPHRSDAGRPEISAAR